MLLHIDEVHDTMKQMVKHVEGENTLCQSFFFFFFSHNTDDDDW